ncbi:MAG: hypothetical protein KAJ18_01760 [Candidatus Omnitrophica bacterium]|nr:hypothetical protein [Candidatus Omnitrophota bacterium]
MNKQQWSVVVLLGVIWLVYALAPADRVIRILADFYIGVISLICCVGIVLLGKKKK